MKENKLIDPKHVKQNNPNDDEEILKNNEEQLTIAKSNENPVPGKGDNNPEKADTDATNRTSV